ncbi:MAG: hypothetical protein IJJ73_05090 [Bacteroidaceae bacterium]|nr:hypothetical protein [Bacteroidaceae bacterium]
MKKLFTPLLMLAALLSSTQAWADNYDLYVGGVQVTDDNKSNITSSAITGGKVTYNPTNKYLVISDGTVITRAGDCINSSIDGLLIVFSGSATITSTSSGASDAGLYLSKPTTITYYSGAKAPVVTINNTGSGCAIRTSARLSIMGNRITASAANNDAIYGRSSGTLNVSYTEIKATGGSGKAGITGFSGGINLLASVPAYGLTISDGAVMQNGSAVQTATIYCAATIGGVNVSTSSITLNTSNTGASSASGTAQYNNSTNTLTLTNVNVDGKQLITRVPGLTVKFVGDASITNSGIAYDAYRDVTMESDNIVKLTSTSNSSALYINGNSSVTLKMKELQAMGGNHGVIGGTSCKLILEKYSSDCVYKFAGANGNVNVKNLVMNDMDISTPNSYWNSSDGYVYYNGAIDKVASINSGTWFQAVDKISYYDLWVAGTHVRTNSSQYIASPYMNGVATYDNSTKTLTMADKTISGQPSEAKRENCAIYSQIPDLTINATGTNNWTTGHICVNLGGGGTNTIKGSGALNITSNDNAAINVWNTTNLTLARTSGKTALKGKYGFSGTAGAALAINKDGSNGGYYTFSGANGHITSTPTLNLGTGVRIATSYHWFNPEAKAVYYKNDLASASGNTLWIRGDVTWTDYPISIAGSRLYGETGTGSGNIYGFWNEYVKGGTITYNPSTKTLKLDNANIDYSAGNNTNDGIILTNSGTTLNISVQGNNTLAGSTPYAGLWLQGSNVTLEGSGTLNVSGGRQDNVYGLQESTITVKGNMTLEALTKGIGTNNDAKELIVAENAVVKAKQLSRVKTLTLNDGQTIVEPFKATFNSANKRVEVNGSLAQDVVIQKVEKYDLAVCDVDVNSYNKDDILRDGGAFKYDPSTKRLTITEADIDDPDVSEGVYNYGIEGLNIAIEGENHFRVKDDVFKMKNSTSFSGNGSVKGELTASDGFGIYLYDSGSTYTSTLNGPKFEFTGYRAVGGSANNLVIEKGVLAFNPNSSSDARILNVQNLTLGSGMIIAKPQGGTFDSSKKGIVVNGSLYNGYAVICQKGDVNLDGSVTIADAVAVLNAMAGQEVPGNPDVNGDKEVSIADFVAVLNIMAGQ